MDGQSSNPNPSTNDPYKPKLAFHFLRALSHINHTTPRPPPPRRTESIKRAAYNSMAYAAGPRRAWSRALLRRIRSRSMHRAPVVPRRAVVIRRRPVRIARPRPGEPRRSDDLRKLVPGGKGMEFGSLLEETMHYIQCLSATVQLMNNIVDSST